MARTGHRLRLHKYPRNCRRQYRRIVGDMCGRAVQGEHLDLYCRAPGHYLEQTMAVGDGLNDLPMLPNATGLVAYHAKAVVKENARHAISTSV